MAVGGDGSCRLPETTLFPGTTAERLRTSSSRFLQAAMVRNPLQTGCSKQRHATLARYTLVFALRAPASTSLGVCSACRYWQNERRFEGSRVRRFILLDCASSCTSDI